jgi:peptidyl-prolyl cis-trans isomerase SurA
MRRYLLIAFSLLAAFLSAPAQAQVEGIAAVVNEDAITMSDVEDRMRLIIASSGLPNTPEIKNKLSGQVVGSLIEEQIKIQEGRRLEIDVTQDEINQGFATIAQQNNIPVDKFTAMLTQSGINIGTLHHQIEAQIAWGKVVQKEVRPKITVTDSDVDEGLARFEANIGRTEYLLAEVLLPVDSVKSESDTLQLANNLISEIRAGKVPFAKVAQQFSKAPGAEQGGDIGWVQQGQLPEELDRVLPTLIAGGVSQPIRSLSGYHILHLRESRDITKETTPSREGMYTTIGTQRLERAQRRYYMDLKASAFIENRVES